MNKDQLMVAAIKEGTVIDHIPPSRLFEVISLLHLDCLSTAVVVGANLDSQEMGKKSIIKVADKFFTDNELNQLAVAAPNVTLCIIRNYEVVEKKKVILPDELIGIVRCNNPKCITNNEPVATRFHAVGSDRQHLRCHYCEHEQLLSEVSLV